jgi:hypothetical protein
MEETTFIKDRKEDDRRTPCQNKRFRDALTQVTAVQGSCTSLAVANLPMDHPAHWRGIGARGRAHTVNYAKV